MGKVATEIKKRNKGKYFAETARFELAIQFPVYTLSRRAPSTTRTRLRYFGLANVIFILVLKKSKLRFKKNYKSL